MRSDDDYEWVIEKEFVDRIEDEGWMTLKADKIKRGWSDQILFGPDGKVYVVEFKSAFGRKNRKGEKLQDHYRKIFASMGHETRKIRGWREAEKLFEELTGEKL